MGFQWISLKEGDRLQYLGVDEKDIKMVLQEIERVCVDWIHLANDRDNLAGYCEHGNEHSGFVKCGEFLGWLRKCQLLKQHSPPRCQYPVPKGNGEGHMGTTEQFQSDCEVPPSLQQLWLGTTSVRRISQRDTQVPRLAMRQNTGNCSLHCKLSTDYRNYCRKDWIGQAGGVCV